MESLIFLLVVLIVIITNIFKMQKKQKESSSQQQASPEGGWKKGLRDLFAEMQGEAVPPSGEKSRRQPVEGRSTGWEDLLSSEDIISHEREKEPAPAGQAPSPSSQEPGEAKKRSTLIESRSREGRTPEGRIGRTDRREPAPPLPEPALRKRSHVRRVSVSTGQLRQAVVWYEVLGPPMSLRDPEREMWL
ncbi:MAG: hypothetical protein ACLFML_01450 [Desulfobacterales bacterium]